MLPENMKLDFIAYEITMKTVKTLDAKKMMLKSEEKRKN